MPAENHKKGTQIKSISFHKTGHPGKSCTVPFQKTSWNAKAHRNFAQTLKKDSFWFVKTESKGQIPNDRKSNRPSENKNQSRKFQRAELRSDYTLRKNQIDIHDASQQQAKEIHLVKKAKDPIKRKPEENAKRQWNPDPVRNLFNAVETEVTNDVR